MEDYPGLRSYRTMHQQVVDRIGRMIVESGFAEGTALPPEAELCASLGVSRGALREAIKSLVSKGMLTVRPRTGTRVRSTRDWSLLDPSVLAWVLNSPSGDKLVADVTQLRNAVEPVAAASAALLADSEGIGRLEALLEEMERAAADLRPDAFVEADYVFHQTLLELSENDLFVSLGRALQAAMAGGLTRSAAVPGAISASVPLHQAVVSAIKDGNVLAADAAMRAVVDAAIHDLSTATASNEGASTASLGGLQMQWSTE